MFAFLGKRILILIATLLLVSGMIFIVLQVIPGDPAQIILGIQATPENLQELRHKLGLDQPLAVQYWNWLRALVRIQSSSGKPGDAFLSVRYRDSNFWIDDRDLRPKKIFSFLMFVFTLVETGEKAAAPFATVPTN